MSALKQGYDGRQAAAGILAFVACLLVTSSPARANSYHDFLCRIPYGTSAGRPAPADDVSYATNGIYVYSGNGCAGGGSLYAGMDGGVSHPYGDSGSVTFNAPAGVTIGAFAVWRYEADTAVQPFGAPASNLLYAPGPPSVEGLCAQSLGCGSRGTPYSPFDPSNEVAVASLSGVTQIQWSGACGGGPGGVCPASGAGTLSSQYDVYAGDVVLVDNAPPTVGSVGGPLVAGGTLAGQQTVSFNAADSQSGVYGGSLIVDGRSVLSQILDANGSACQSLGVTADGQRSFEHAQPCKASLSASLTFNTNALAAGQHSLELVVDDAAGNQTVAYDGTITTSGSPLIGVNGASIHGPNIANGRPCAGEALSLQVNGKTKAPVIPYGKPATVKGLLHCGAVPIRGARIAIGTLEAPPGAAINSSVQTALDGSFEYKVPTGPDRILRFSYTAFSDDPSPSANATATIMIRPSIKLKIGPHRTRNGHGIHWTGTITGGPYPRQGVGLVAEVRQGRRWKIFDQIVTDHLGRFHYRYRFHATSEPQTYTFRVALLNTSAQGYAYTPGASSSTSVHVVP